ncbi:MAG: hypothetical protein WB711_23105 [Terriglobales bacterium]
MKTIASLLFLLATPLLAQNSATPVVDPWKALRFLEGTWEAKAKGDAGIAVNGTYSFKTELDDHVFARHSKKSDCKGPTEFDCEHADLLYVYQDAPSQPLKAIYFDNEGHVLHYDVSTPDSTTALFVTDSSQPGPQFRLVYELKGTVMSGKFQMRMPGQATKVSR